METWQISIVLCWYCASAMLVMAMCYGVYMELTKPERDAMAQVAQLRAHIGGLERANKIYAEGIAEIVQVQPGLELDPRLLALLKETFRSVIEEMTK